MENNHTRRIHPLVAAAAVSVTLVSLIGIAAITGVLPNSLSKSAPVDANMQAQLAQQAAPDNTMSANAQPPQQYAANDTRAMNTQAPVQQQPAQPYSAQVAQANTGAGYQNSGNTAPAVTESREVCRHCGRVESIQAVQHQAQTSGLGVAAGAVLGGVLGHQVGGGTGNTLATVAGAVGGGYAGNEVEKRSKTSTSYRVRVRMDDGKFRTFPQNDWRVGDRVKEVNGRLVSEG
ncbi:glycine zipper 2TM domain-containing protein [Undibacterium sp. TJN25]|uniref:glycine zipper 2TM domain-containing protein n=1 Tax=Undibacterium sp. TJN25 TaxID=3413056 RepID=UPI003BEF5291